MRSLRHTFVLTLALASAVSLHARQQAPASRSDDQPHTNHAVGAYDARLQRVVLIGADGDPMSGQRDRVWSWTGTRWEPLDGAGPPARVNASAAFDRSRGALIVVGGSRKSAEGAWEVVGDNWAGGAHGWQPLTDIPPRDHHAIVEDGRGGVLMFGGIPAERSGPWPSDTWILDGASWRRVATDGPAGRGRTALAYDSRRKQVVLFGGVSAPPAGQNGPQTFLGDTWIWNGTQWTQASASGPRGRYAHAMVYDERADVVWLYSGAGAHSGAPLSDMWRWDGRTWTEVPLSGATPGARYQPVMVYDRARGRTVLYGGINNASDTWEWDGARWSQISAGALAHGARLMAGARANTKTNPNTTVKSEGHTDRRVTSVLRRSLNSPDLGRRCSAPNNLPAGAVPIFVTIALHLNDLASVTPDGTPLAMPRDAGALWSLDAIRFRSQSLAWSH